MVAQWYVIVNPASDRGRTGRKWSAIRDGMDTANLDYDVGFTTATGHGGQLAREAVRKGYRGIISIGGDGSHHDVVNGLCNFNATQSIEMGIVPMGTGNDWARTLGINRNLEHALAIVKDGHAMNHCIGKVVFAENSGQNRCFINVAGFCLDGEVIRQLQQTNTHKWGSLTYLFAGVRGLLSYQGAELHLSAIDQVVEGKFVMLNAGLGKFSGGGLSLTPHADPTAGTMAVSAIPMMPKWKLISNIYRLYTGSILSMRSTIGFNASAISVRPLAGSQVPVEADGEFLGYCPAKLTITPHRFRVLVP